MVAAGARPVARQQVDTSASGISPRRFIGSAFSTVVGVSDHGARRYKRELISEALSRLGLAAADATMIGDRRYDMEGAAQHGMRAVGVLWGFGDADELRAAGRRPWSIRPPPWSPRSAEPAPERPVSRPFPAGRAPRARDHLRLDHGHPLPAYCSALQAESLRRPAARGQPLPPALSDARRARALSGVGKAARATCSSVANALAQLPMGRLSSGLLLLQVRRTCCLATCPWPPVDITIPL
ncbi:HAD hydrolase-like protein [Luteimonas sp. 100069]|uniref:HAD hydrolase-like protein n=1 Tax=Luteimonas sp. 100069 TaxID=2006109 RepID=UPI001F2C9458|nr:HAD hydrolase-like protein [Luteimonas sp. 100069]